MLTALCNLTIYLATLPEISDVVYVKSKQYMVVKPRQINFKNGNKPKYSINIPSQSNSKFYQLSDIFSTYGYAPYHGKEISNSSTIITGSMGRFVYKTNTCTDCTVNPGIFDIVDIAIDLVEHNTVLYGKILFLPLSGMFISSHFLLDDDGWMIILNNPIHTPLQVPSYCNWNSYFIAGTDNYVHYNTNYHYDKSLWYFQAPTKYNTDLSLAYLGWIDFYQIFLSGDFSKLNRLDLFPVVRIRCEILSYSVEYYLTAKFDNSTTKQFHIKLDENIWKISCSKDLKMSRHVFIECLTNVSSFEILGDWTVGIETVGLDSVQIYKPQ